MVYSATEAIVELERVNSPRVREICAEIDQLLKEAAQSGKTGIYKYTIPQDDKTSQHTIDIIVRLYKDAKWQVSLKHFIGNCFELTITVC